MNPEELVEKCIRRDKVAWNEFVLRYKSIVKRACCYKLNKLNSRSLMSESDDIVQEVFLGIWEDNKLTKLKDLSCLKPWLVIVTIRTTLNYCKKRWKEQQKTVSLNQSLSEDGFTLEDLIPSKALNPSKAFEVKERMERIQDRVKMLKGKERRALELNLYRGKRQSEVAKVMDIPVSAVSSLIARAKRKVKSGIKEYQLV